MEPTPKGSGETEPVALGLAEKEPATKGSVETEPMALGSGETF